MSKKILWFFILFFSLTISLTNSGCISSGIRVYTSGFTGAYGNTEVVVNSTPYFGKIYIDGKYVTDLPAWGQRSVTIEKIFINTVISTTVEMTVRIKYADKIITFHKHIYICNYSKKSHIYIITQRMLYNKIRWE